LPGKNQYISLFLVILVGVRGGVELAIPGSAVECFTTEPNPLCPYQVLNTFILP